MHRFIPFILLCLIGLTARACPPAPCCTNKACGQAPALQSPGEGDKRPRGDRRPDFSPEKFRRELSAFLQREAGLSADEASRFLPVYFQMKEQLRALDHQEHTITRRAAEGQTSDRDCRRVIDQTLSLENKALRIKRQYYARLAAIVGEKKLLRVIEADNKFGRRLFRRMTQGDRPGK